MALALELEAMAPADLNDQERARELSTRALTIRQRIVSSMTTDYTAGSIYKVGGGVSRPTLAHLPIMLASGLLDTPVDVPWWNGMRLRLTA